MEIKDCFVLIENDGFDLPPDFYSEVWLLFGRNRKCDKWIEVGRFDTYSDALTAEGVERTQFDCAKYYCIKHISALLED